METQRLYWSDPRRKSFETTVRERRDDGVVLDRTAFYPTGGGQPHDTGRLTTGEEDWPVADVVQRDEIVHVLDGTGPPVGATVTGELDWDRRWGHMRHHTAQHILSAVLLDEFDAPTVGNQLYADRARLDCGTDRLAEDDLATIEDHMNEVIEADKPVRAYSLSREEAEATMDPERTRLDLLPAAVDPVRIVEIGGVDRTACGGTHVARTGEIGPVAVTGRETGGSDRERVRFRIED